MPAFILRKAAAGALASLITTGCTTGGEPELPLPEQWLGVRSAELIDDWGAPTEVIDGDHGHTVYVFQGIERDRRTSLRNPHYYQAGQDALEHVERTRDFSNNRQHIASDVVVYHCAVLFAVHPDDAVVAWHWQGNRCRNRFVRRVHLNDAEFLVMRTTPDETPDIERAIGANADHEHAQRDLEQALQTP